jgi:hypothetical protein
LSIGVVMALAAGASACRRQPPPPPYTPGLGEIMSLQQMRHMKLWFAAEAGNWPLADYELKEIKEGFDDAMTFQGNNDELPLVLKDVMPKKVNVPLDDLAAAVRAQNRANFETAFDSLTMACNECHQAENHGFNVVQRPASNPYANQIFAPVRDKVGE